MRSSWLQASLFTVSWRRRVLFAKTTYLILVVIIVIIVARPTIASNRIKRQKTQAEEKIYQILSVDFQQQQETQCLVDDSLVFRVDAGENKRWAHVYWDSESLNVNTYSNNNNGNGGGDSSSSATTTTTTTTRVERLIAIDAENRVYFGTVSFNRTDQIPPLEYVFIIVRGLF